MNLGVPELLIILFVLLLIFGGGRLPAWAAAWAWLSVHSGVGTPRPGEAGPPEDPPGPESAPA